MTTLSMALIVSLICVILWAIFNNMLLKAELRGSYTAGARQPQNMPSFHPNRNMNASPNAGLLFFALCIMIFFGYISLSMGWLI